MRCDGVVVAPRCVVQRAWCLRLRLSRAAHDLPRPGQAILSFMIRNSITVAYTITRGYLTGHRRMG